MQRNLLPLNMSNHYKMTLRELDDLAQATAERIRRFHPQAQYLYGVPRGGIPAALAIINHFPPFILVDDPLKADVIVDDLIDSGCTERLFSSGYPGKPFYGLLDKRTDARYKGAWVIFPWEATPEKGIEDNIIRLLQFVGEDPARGGLLETPARVAKAWSEWCSGYHQDPAAVLKSFTDGAEKCDEMVVVKDIPIYSKCEHHLADIFGTATIAYIPDGRIVGLSKLSRLADVFARRLQVQERLTNQIADAIEQNLKPKGVGVIIRARHMCMESRGIHKQGHVTVTSALRGVIKDKSEARGEFLLLAK